MKSLSSWRLIWKRNASDWKLLLAIAVGILVATSVVAGTPTYLQAMEKLGVKNAVESRSDSFLDISVYTPYVVLEQSQLDRTDRIVANAVRDHIPHLAKEQERYIKAPTLMLALPGYTIQERVGNSAPPQGYLQYLSNLERHVTVADDGRMPSDAVLQTEQGPLVEVAIGNSTASFFKLRPGDVVVLAPAANVPEKIFARITALLAASDPTERYWQGSANVFLNPSPQQTAQGDVLEGETEAQPPLALFVTRKAMVEALGRTYPGTVVSSTWFLLVDRETVKDSPVSLTIKRLQGFESELVSSLPRTGVFTGISPLFKEFNDRLFFSRVPFYLLMTMILVTVLYYLAMMIAYLVQRREDETALLRSRGVGIIQLMRLYTLEGIPLAGTAVIVGPLLAAGVIALLGKLPYFQYLTKGHLLSVDLGPTPFLASLGAGILCLLILVIPRAVGSRSAMIAHKLRSSRPPAVPIFHRYYLDIALLVIGGVVFWELKTRGSLISGGLFGSPSVNEALLFAPIVFLVALALVFMRLFPLIARLFSRAIAGRVPVWATLSLWHMSRSPLRYSWLVLLLVLAAGLGILATTMGGTLSRSYEERVSYDTATDLRVEGLPSFVRASRPMIKDAYLSIPGASGVSLAFRGTGNVGTTRTGPSFAVLAMETQQFPYMAWYREDFSRSSLPNIMRALLSGEQFPRLELPKDARRIGIWVKPGAQYANVFLWVVLRDAEGMHNTVSLGPLGKPDWRFLEAEVPPYAKSPVTLEAIEIYEPVYGPTGTPGYMYLDNAVAMSSSSENPKVLDGFEDLTNWTPLATAVLSSDSLSLTRTEAHDGRSAALFTWGKGTNRGVRGIYRSPSGGPLPVVASTSFLAETGRNVGDDMVVSVFDRFIPVVIRDAVDYFPTLNPVRSGFLLADMDLLLDQMNLLSPISTVSPNEIFLSTTPDSHETAMQVVQSFVRTESQIHDRPGQLKAIKMDPLITAGWRVLVFLSIGVILFTAGLGYVTYLLSSAASTRVEMGILQAMGLSRSQLLGLLALEHIVMVVIGLALGTWAGLQMSNLSVSSVSQTEGGDPILPPFVMVTEWSFMALIFAVLAGVVLASLFAANRSIARLDLNTISKMEG